MKLLNYAPDLDPTIPGVLTNCSSIVPSLKGMVGAPSAQSLGIDALAAACQGASVLTLLDDSNRLFAGSATKLYELSGTSWTDRTRAVGGDYGLGADVRWSFSQFGNVSLAANKADTLQSSSSGAFANVTGAPKATIVETVGQFVFLFDTNESTYGDSPNRWICCAKGDYTDWTYSVATECATGLLTSSPGPIKAGKRFGDNIIAYKERSMFLGVYVGAGPIWDFREVPGTAGALGQYAVANVGTPDAPKHIFMGHDDFYRYDGSQAVPIGAPLRETVYAEINRSYAHLSIAVHDRAKGLVRFHYCSSGNTTPDKCVVYNYKTDKWGRDDQTVEMALEYVTGGFTYNALGTTFATYADLPNLTYDSSYWTSGSFVPAVIDTSHVLKTLNAGSVTSSITTGDYGDNNKSSELQRVTPRFLTKPSAANMINYYRNDLGSSLTTDATTPMDSRGRFDVLREAFWHRLRFDFTGGVELANVDPVFVPGSDE